jgi:hypothetical protein
MWWLPPRNGDRLMPPPFGLKIACRWETRGNMGLFPISSGGGQFTFVPLTLWYKFATRGCRAARAPCGPSSACSGPRRTASCRCRSPRGIRTRTCLPRPTARHAARVRSLAARLPALAGRTRQPLRAAVDAATFDEEELLAALPRADALVALHPVRALATFKITLQHP